MKKASTTINNKYEKSKPENKEKNSTIATKKIEQSISNTPNLSWAYRRFFLNNDKQSFKIYYLQVIDNAITQLKKDKEENSVKIKNINNLKQAIDSDIDNIDDNADTPTHIKAITKAINYTYKILSRGQSNSNDTENLNKIDNELAQLISTYESQLAINKQDTIALHTKLLLVEARRTLLLAEADKKTKEIAAKINLSSDKGANSVTELLSQEIKKNKAKQIEIELLTSYLLNSIEKSKKIQALNCKTQQLSHTITSAQEALIKLSLTIEIMEKLKNQKDSLSETSIQKTSKELIQSLKPKLKALQSNTVSIGTIGILYLIYIAVFATFSASVQTAIFGTVLLGGSILTSILFGMVASLVATPIAITISKLRNKIDSNKLFNLILLCSIFAVFAFIAPSIELLLFGHIAYTTVICYKFMFALVSTAITYSALNIFEILIKSALSNRSFVSLSIIKDTIREIALISLLTFTVEPLLVIISLQRVAIMQSKGLFNIAEIDFIKHLKIPYIFNFILDCVVSYGIYILLEPTIGISYLSAAASYFLYITFMLAIMHIEKHTTEINLPLAYTRLLDFTARQITKAYNFIEACLDHSILITANLISIFTTYRKNIPAKLEIPATNIKYLDYALCSILFILQLVIDASLLSIFSILYLTYKTAETPTQNMKDIGKNHPIKTTIFFIATATICAVFASPIQLFVLGQLVMRGSPIINILFGTMASLVSTLFGANACVATNAYVVPPVSRAFKHSCKTVNDFWKAIPYFGNSESPKAKV